MVYVVYEFTKNVFGQGRNQRYGVILVIVSAVCFGFIPIFAKYAYEAGTDAVTVLFIRFVIASAIMLTVTFFRRPAIPRGKSLFFLFLLGAVCYTGHSFSYFYALNYAPAGTVATIFYIYPAIVTVVSAIFLKQAVGKPEVLALAIALAGILLLVGFQRGGELTGIMLSINAALIYAIYVLAGSKITEDVDAFTASTISITSTAFAYGIIIFFKGPVLPDDPSGYIPIVGLAIVSTVIAIVSFFAGMKIIGPVKGSMLSTIEPLTSVILAVILFGEVLTPIKISGGVLVLAAAIILAGSKSQSQKTD